MNHSSFVLIDFGMRKVDIEEILYELKIKGYKVIIAHPERYFYTSYEDLVRLKKQGAYFQVSAPHLIKEGSKEAQKKALRLLKEDLIDFIGSDSHGLSTVDAMEKAYKMVAKKKDEATAKKLFYDNAYKYLITP
jgi:tyrosine-protein phosphatase YwqE